MAQDFTPLIILGALGGVAYYGYQQGWFSGVLPSSSGSITSGYTAAPTAAMSIADQNSVIAAMLKTGSTPAQIQQFLNGIASSYSTCTSPNSWVGPLQYASFLPGGSGQQKGEGCSNSFWNSPPAPPSTVVPLGCSAPNVMVNGICTAPLAPVVATPTQTYSSLYNQLQTATGTTMLTPDQWSFYWASLPGNSAISPADFATLLSNMGIADRTQPIPLATFITGLKTLNSNQFGISGLGNYPGIPMGAIHGGF